MLKSDTTRQYRAGRPDGQAFDNILIRTEPRFKESELSGDEWRISAVTEFYRKGKLMHSVRHGNVEYAVRMLDADMITARETVPFDDSQLANLCDQEGCENEATVTYKKKFDYCREGHKSEIVTLGQDAIYVRKFCNEHKHRGDCGLDDSDTNYEVVP